MAGAAGSRRAFLAQAGGALAAGAAAAWLMPAAAARVLPAARAVRGREPADVAADEDFWFEVQQAFAVDRSLINMNNGGVSPAPRSVIEAQRRFTEYANHAPARTMWSHLKPEEETVRARLAGLFGSDPEEIAITRNATESLDNVIFGLDLARGDEVLTSDQDYGSMLAAWRQRAARDGIVLNTVPLPVPAPSQDALFDAFAAGVTDRTRVILVSHVVNITGQILPVRRIVDLARARGIDVIVDGAHSFALLPVGRDDLGCDYFGTSLHKWLNAPIGAGMLFVRRERVKDVWPLFGQGEPADVRKFEGIGTHPAAHRLAISEAVVFHEAVGAERKLARLRYLRDRWARRVEKNPRVRFHAQLDDQQSMGIATVGVEGIAAADLGRWLFDEHRIVVTGIDHEDVRGIRVTPGIYTTLQEVDLFGDALADAIERGI